MITNICGSFGHARDNAHNECAAIDIVSKTMTDDKVTLEKDYNLICDIHKNGSNLVVPENAGNNHLHCIDKFWVEQRIGEIEFTSYNPVVGQTDSSPCIGARMDNLCERDKNGERIIALSQDLVSWTGRGAIRAGDKVTLTSTDFPDDPRCNGEFVVLDTMNVRYTKRGDIFTPDRKDNISCKATLHL